jgi:hypothetical protein
MTDRHRYPGIVIRPDSKTRAELERAAEDEGPNVTSWALEAVRKELARWRRRKG